MGKYIRGSQCPYQPGDGVCCPDHTQCETCGWNPIVKRKRTRQILLTRSYESIEAATDQEDSSGLLDED